MAITRSGAAPRRQVAASLPVAEIRPSPQMEAVINQLKSALVEAYKLDGVKVKVLVVEKMS